MNQGDREVEKLMLTPEEVASALGISRRKVYELMHTRSIDSVKIGKCRRIPRIALDRFVEKLHRDAAA